MKKIGIADFNLIRNGSRNVRKNAWSQACDGQSSTLRHRLVFTPRSGLSALSPEAALHLTPAASVRRRVHSVRTAPGAAEGMALASAGKQHTQSGKACIQRVASPRAEPTHSRHQVSALGAECTSVAGKAWECRQGNACLGNPHTAVQQTRMVAGMKVERRPAVLVPIRAARMQGTARKEVEPTRRAETEQEGEKARRRERRPCRWARRTGSSRPRARPCARHLGRSLAEGEQQWRWKGA